MEINIADNFVKFQDKKDNLEDKETLFVLSPKYKKFRESDSGSPQKRKISKKSLVALTISLVLIGGLVTGLTIGLVLSKMKIENLTQNLENLQTNFSQAQNSSQETIAYLETLVEAHEDLALHFEIEHQNHIDELQKNFTKSKNLTKIEIEELKLQNENLQNETFSKFTLSLKNIINTQDIYGRTGLYRAVTKNNTKEVENLLKLGADPNIRDHTIYRSPLEYANLKGYAEIVQMLKKYGAN